MQLGMIGLGRMGANMVQRLLNDGHDCVVFDTSPASVESMVEKGASGSASLAELCAKLEAPRNVWVMVPAAIVDNVIQELIPLLQAGDTITITGISKG